MAKSKLRLGVNIDHVATLRNARGGAHPDPVAAALLAVRAGADGITAHLREDRRHIRDDDIYALKERLTVPLNFEMAATADMVAIAQKVQPHACCLVPEKREERTTEGGLDVAANAAALAPFVQTLKGQGVRVSLFIEPEQLQLEAARRLGAAAVELHTGRYAALALTSTGEAADEVQRLQNAARIAHDLGLDVHAGHGLTQANVGHVAAIPQLVELNIGHFLIGEAVFVGLEAAIRSMRAAMVKARRA